MYIFRYFNWKTRHKTLIKNSIFSSEAHPNLFTHQFTFIKATQLASLHCNKRVNGLNSHTPHLVALTNQTNTNTPVFKI